MQSSIRRFIGCSALLAVGGCNAVTPSKTGSPVVAVPSSVELGRIAQGAKKEAVVRLVNQGTSPLHISGVSTSCGCTTSQVADKVLQPGQPVALKVHYNSMGFSGREEKFVTVSFTDGQPALDIAVRADIYPLLKISPPTVDFGAVPVGAAKAKTIFVERLDGGPLPLPRFINTKELKIQTTRKASSRVALRFVMQPMGFAGARQNSLQLQTGLSALPQISVPVRASVVGHYLITPREMNFGAVHGQAVQRVTISNARSKPLQNLEILSVPKGCSATLTKNAGKYVLTLKCSGDRNRRIINDAAILKTGDAPETLVKIPVLAVLGAA